MEAYEKSRLINKRSGLSGDEFDIELEPGVQHKPAGGSGGIRRNKKALALFLLIGVAFLLLLVIIIVSVTASHRGKSNSAPTAQQEICASPPVLLVSLDGLWSGYLKQNHTPFLNSLAASGVRAEYMRSEFPTETFPNHFSIVTGLHPESHGIVNNKFYDSGFQANFTIKGTQGRPATQRESRWWLAEPIWVTAIEHGQKSNVYFWPGSEVEKIRPTVYFPYDASVPFDERIDTILSWLDASSDERPRFMAAYFNQPDNAAHKSGPYSDAVNAALSRVDDTMKSLFDGLRERGVEDCVNIIIVSDHGMTAYNSSKLVKLNSFLPSEVVMMNGVQSDVTVPQGADKDDIINQTYSSLALGATKDEMPFRVYHTRDLPLRLHTGHFNKQRYGDLYLIGDEGAFLSRTGSGATKGLHGYDNILIDMQAIFIAHGPAFRKDYVSEPFANIELYNLMCGLLGITPSPNNGTMGSLYHLLTPSLLPSLPPPQTLHVQELEAAKGVRKSCPFPVDQEMYDRRSFCEKCVCWHGCTAITNATIDEANQLLNLTADQIKEYQKLHLPWGVPSGGEGSSSCLLTQQEYVTLYSNTLHIPLWTAFKLANKQTAFEQGVDSCLRQDPRVPPASSSNCTDYTTEDKNEDLIAVRLAAAALSTQSTRAQRLNANLLSSVVPQMRTFNTSVWVPLTELLRSWAKSSTIHVFLGSVLDTNRDGRRDNDANYTWWLGDEVGGVAIPTHFYAVVVRCLDGSSGAEPADCDPDKLDAAGLLLQHPTEFGDPSPVSKLLRFSLTPVRDIERVTGVDFFPSLSPQQQNTLELRITNELWSTENM